MLLPLTQNLAMFMPFFGQSPHAVRSFMFSYEILSLIAMQSSLQIQRLPLHVLRHYRILHV
jgi:hypothetical protein